MPFEPKKEETTPRGREMKRGQDAFGRPVFIDEYGRMTPIGWKGDPHFNPFKKKKPLTGGKYGEAFYELKGKLGNHENPTILLKHDGITHQFAGWIHDKTKGPLHKNNLMQIELGPKIKHELRKMLEEQHGIPYSSVAFPKQK